MKRTLRRRLQNYTSKKDICCEADVDRTRVIGQLLDKYKTFANDDYLNAINNDVIKLIGYRVDLVKKKDSEGVYLWDQLDKRMFSNKKVSEQKVTSLLQQVPLFFLFSLLGYASYKEATQG